MKHVKCDPYHTLFPMEGLETCAHDLAIFPSNKVVVPVPVLLLLLVFTSGVYY